MWKRGHLEHWGAENPGKLEHGKSRLQKKNYGDMQRIDQFAVDVTAREFVQRME